MTELRWVQLNTLSSSSAGTGLSSPAPLPATVLVPPAEHSGLQTGTVRLVLPLFEPTERAFPEFSYPQLLDIEVVQSVHFNASLTKSQGGKPQQKDRVQDLINIGYGYDDEDSFIDNSEAYDESVPASITTKLGGFYVNSGLLQFRQASNTEPESLSVELGDGPSAEKRREASKKCKLNGPDKALKGCDDDAESDAKPRPVFEPAEVTVKKKKKLNTLSVTSALRKCEKERERQMSAKAPPRGIDTLTLGPADAGGGGCMSLTDPLLRLWGFTKGPALDFAPDCVLISEDGASSLPPASTDSYGPLHLPDGTLLTQGTGAEDTASRASPEGFPPVLEDSIHKLMMASKTSEGESKVKYTPEINGLLLQIDAQCRQHGGPLRSRVFAHLCAFLPCSKGTLLRRVSRLKRSSNEEPHVDQPIQEESHVDLLLKTLKEAIEKTMAEQILSWKEMCTAHDRSVSMVPEECEERAGKRPKKHFKWNNDIRESLRQLLKQAHREGTGQDVDQYLRSLLEGGVKALWPKGWMSSRILLKEAKKLLSPELMKVKNSD